MSPETVSVEQKETTTGTFVDGEVGDLVYFRDGSFYLISLPSRVSTQLAGIGEDLVANFPHVRPAWSRGGQWFALVADDRTIVVVEFASGKLIRRIDLNSAPLDLSKEILLSFSPDDFYLLVKENRDSTHSNLRFYETETGNLISEQSCRPTGFWMNRQSLYISTCAVGIEELIVAIDPSPPALLTKVTAEKTYTLINEFDSNHLLVTKTGVPGKLTLTGKYTILDPKTFAELGSIEAFTDLPKALAKQIEQRKDTEVIDDLVVAPSGSFAIYHTQKGLWLIDLPLSSEPFFLTLGELPSPRPF